MKTWASILVLAVALCDWAVARTWTRTNGKTVEGEFVQAAAGTVLIKQDSGNTVRISLNQLSKEDQDFVKAQKEELQKEAASTNKPVLRGARAAKPSYGPPPKDGWQEWEPGKVYDKTTAGPASAGYHICIPTTFSATNPPPILFLFHPKGNGPEMVNAFKASAEKVGWTVVGIDKARNKMSLEEGGAIAREVMDEVEKAVPFNDKRIYVGGFSGGATRAYYASYTCPEPIAGIIACGGWIGGRELYESRFRRNMAVAMINGKDDGGAGGWAGSDGEALSKRKCQVKVFTFEGGHQIAPAAVLDDVMKWMEEDWKTRGSKHAQEWGPPR